MLGVLNENAGAAVLLVVLAAGALNENPELPDGGPPNENPDILYDVWYQIYWIKVIYFLDLL